MADIRVDEMVARYIKARDLKKKLDDEHKEKIAKLVSAMDLMEAALLQQFNKLGIDSGKCEAGTAYKSTRTSATVADMDAFLGFVKENDAWHMLERRCAKTSVEEYIQASGGNLPPGVNYSSEITINVRRS